MQFRYGKILVVFKLCPDEYRRAEFSIGTASGKKRIYDNRGILARSIPENATTEPLQATMRRREDS